MPMCYTQLSPNYDLFHSQPTKYVLPLKHHATLYTQTTVDTWPATLICDCWTSHYFFCYNALYCSARVWSAAVGICPCTHRSTVDPEHWYWRITRRPTPIHPEGDQLGWGQCALTTEVVDHMGSSTTALMSRVFMECPLWILSGLSECEGLGPVVTAKGNLIAVAF